ncbi:ATP-grasp domain-containing protein [Leifsonia naganoensis]|uniref:Glutathione synthase/RimK-type ligase-like ATP-grasp enzyme n=1 Tax=Leifsonia naganoensis TaxID=150025 RepID=A0A853DYY5_9MICO|nr:alpha-L-glutamate ligase [Leifsonia naganoensis]NYK11945.1 glutathione synthase/RimK-type ligase-like ATP-grasp enzyme [Leifsonia naganoensis]
MTSTHSTPAVYALHENPDWFEPFRRAFEEEGVPLVEWLLVDGTLDLDAVPPEGVFWSRISASSHTRGHGLSKDYARSVLSWLESHGRRTVNGRRVLELEVSKVDQLTALRAAGIDTPRTVAAIGVDRLVEAARAFPTPFLTKHNQGGKGLGVQRFDSADELAATIDAGLFETPVDGIVLLQELLVAAEPAITRVELVDGELVYAVRADTELGGFQLCPADACVIDPVTGAELPQQLFRLREGFDHPLVEQYRAFTRRAGIEIAGIEFIETVDGRAVTYDVNTNTNYNAEVEAAAPSSGPRQIARFLGRELASLYAAVG